MISGLCCQLSQYSAIASAVSRPTCSAVQSLLWHNSCSSMQHDGFHDKQDLLVCGQVKELVADAFAWEAARAPAQDACCYSRV